MGNLNNNKTPFSWGNWTTNNNTSVLETSVSDTQLDSLKEYHLSEKVTFKVDVKRWFLKAIKMDEIEVQITNIDSYLEVMSLNVMEPLTKQMSIKSKLQKILQRLKKCIRSHLWDTSFSSQKEDQQVIGAEQMRFLKETITLSSEERELIIQVTKGGLVSFKPCCLKFLDCKKSIEDWMVCNEIVLSSIARENDLKYSFKWNWLPRENFNVNDLIGENLNLQVEIYQGQDSPIGLSSDIFQNDFTIFDMILPKVRSMSSRVCLAKWGTKAKEKLRWNINDLEKMNLLDESISEDQLKFKTPIKPIDSIKYNDIAFFFKNQQQWYYSNFKKYMLDWKPFSKLIPNNILSEELIVEPPKLQLLRTFYKMTEISIIELESLENKLSPLGDATCLTEIIDNDKSSEAEFDVSAVENSEITIEEEQILFKTLEKRPSIVVKGSFGLPSLSNTLIPADKPSSSKLQRPYSKPKSSASSKRSRPHSSLDIIIAKRRAPNTKLSKITNYPILDLLNKTTTNISKEIYSSCQRTPKLTSAITPPSILTPTLSSQRGKNENNNILESSTELSISELPQLPTNGKTTICLDQQFPQRFGAAFFKLERVFELLPNLEIIEMKTPHKGGTNQLNFDLFLTPSCGVVFLGRIQLVQLNLETGVPLIFQSIEEIGDQVLSLIIVYVRDDAPQTAANTQTHIEYIIGTLKKWGVHVIEIGPQPMEIVKCFIELIKSYAKGNGEIEWDEQYTYFENLGIQNPLLIDWILRTKNELSSLNEHSKRCLLSKVCSQDLTDVLVSVFRS